MSLPVALGLLAACQTPLPPLAAPLLPAAAPLAAATPQPGDAAPQSAGAGAWPGARWWERYGDDTLNALVARALQVSPTLAAADARQARAVSALELQAGASRVRVDGQAQLQRQRMSENGLFPPQLLGISWYSISDLGLTIDYRPDFWHRQAEALRAAGASARAAEAERAQLGVSVATSVAQLYFTLRSGLQ
jgi:outer membrane protein, multidrug efflux system